MDSIKDSDQVAVKPLLVLAGKIDPHSFLHNEFGLNEIFSLRIGQFTYREILEKQVVEISEHFEIEWNTKDHVLEILRRTDKERDTFVYDTLHYLPNPTTLQEKVRQIKSDKKMSEIVFSKNEFIELRDTGQLFSFLLLKSPHRHFNEFEIQDGFVIKKCTFENKGKREFTFLHHVPKAMRAYFPRVRNYQEGEGWQQYEVEMIRTFDFGRIAMHSKIELQVFKDLLGQIDRYLNDSPKVQVSSRRFKQHLEALFIDKLNVRYQELIKSEAGLKLAEETQLLEKIENLVLLLHSKIHDLPDQELVVTHGDMCFSNILYGTKSKSLKFIDPRGVATAEEIYGPWYYDLAKLSHSVFGQYDLIINDVKPNNELDELFKIMRSHFTSWVTEHGWDFEFLRLCEASLFFSMLPFHVSRPDHAKLQFQSGLKAMEHTAGMRR